MEIVYNNGNFILARSSDPFISFYAIDVKTAEIRSIASGNCGGSAEAFNLFGNQIIGFSSHYFQTNQNQLYSFVLDLTTGTCTPTMLGLPRSFFFRTSLIADTKVSYFKNVVEGGMLYSYNWATGKISSSAFTGQGSDVSYFINNAGWY